MNLVSIILPTYNREKFLVTAFKSIEEQSYANWELIIVDDGSSDDSINLLNRLKSAVSNPVKIISQKNGGPAVARNRGIQEASGDFIAFFDSDDYWLPHHLSNCINVMLQHKDVSWVYAACQRRLYDTNEVLLDSTFYHNRVPNPLFTLKTRSDGKLHIIDDDRATELQITHGIDSGFQNSVLRNNVFKEMQLPDMRIGEDRLFIAMALKSGFKLAFIDDIHVLYMVHSENISDTNLSESNISKRIDVMKQLIVSYELTPKYIPNLNAIERKALQERLASDWFWKLGYSLQWQNGLRNDAIKSYMKGIRLTPLNIKFWKTFIKAFVLTKIFRLK
ncbi:glycosyltransferase family A protein [Paraglaciecola sp. L3A3]|uniref:glycosyltransferase family 2 protein n=1 Tax=Paraglaciecola sp. L3A3 TaxID=2686358 RepID=UPI00131C2576|nr:glycosyltransferase family A protein [Paraglaciecola sp. L3A3]